MKVGVLSSEEMKERQARFHATSMSRTEFERAEMERTGTALFIWWPDPAPLGAFTWCCPGCGELHYGQMGEQPVSGWDEPRWVNSGTRERPTLVPSLGCPRWRDGTCIGHWWLRDGELVRA